MDNGTRNGSSVKKLVVETVSMEMEKPTEQGSAPIISFHDIDYQVNTREGCCSSCRPVTKKILYSVSGIMKPGLNAIMGPTGSGKSSLLDILANRKDPAGLTGDVLVNGAPLPSNFKHFSGYVIQQDILIETLTVRENLWYSANLRLPRSIGKEAKRKRVDEVLFDLGITACADTRIGNEMLRGVSGGEKKRASIAMELITSPSVLFLDEPTTGLDASTANAVISLLKKLSKNGRTIILSIHQPRFSIFRLFDTLTLLSQGRIVYHGAYDSALTHFEALGYQCEEHNNPADFFLDVINGDSTALAASQAVDGDVSGKGDDESATKIASDLAEKFNSSRISEDLKEELSRVGDATKKEKKRGSSSLLRTSYAVPYYYQFFILLRRSFVSMIRNPMAVIGNLLVSLLLGTLFGIFYYQVDNDTVRGPQNRFGVLFFVSTNLLFTSINAIEVFVKERNVFKHEYVSGYYAVAPYFFSSLFADLLPIRTIAPIVFSTITYWMVGLKATASAFFTFLLFVLLTGYAAVSIALFFSSSVSTYAIANLLTTLVYIFSIIFGGLLLNVNSVMDWIGWVKYLSIANYGYSGLSVNEFRGQTFSGCDSDPANAMSLGLGSVCNNTQAVGGVVQHCATVTGEEILYRQLSIGTDGVIADWDMWKNAVALICIIVAMLTLTFIQLARTKMTT